jgi:hypothetical protein
MQVIQLRKLFWTQITGNGGCNRDGYRRRNCA